MAKDDVIVNSSDFNRTVEEMEALTEQLFEVKKELKEINSGITINKEELSSKLDVLDNYLTKVYLIQKQVLGDKSIDKKYNELTSKIIKDFESRIVRMLDIKDEVEKNIKIKNAELELEFNKKINELNERNDKLKKSLKEWVKEVNDNLDVKDISTHATTLSKSAKDLTTAINEQNALQKTGLKGFLYGIGFSVFIFGVAFFLNTKLHFF